MGGWPETDPPDLQGQVLTNSGTEPPNVLMDSPIPELTQVLTRSTKAAPLSVDQPKEKGSYFLSISLCFPLSLKSNFKKKTYNTCAYTHQIKGTLWVKLVEKSAGRRSPEVPKVWALYSTKHSPRPLRMGAPGPTTIKWEWAQYPPPAAASLAP